MNSSLHKQILAIKLFKLTVNDIGEIKKETYKLSYLDKLLPEYCLNKNGHISDTSYYLQYIEEGDDTYYLFDVEYVDQLLEHEIGGLGLDKLIDNYDYRPLFDKLYSITMKNYSMYCGNYQRIVYTLYYYSNSSYCLDEDYDCAIDILGYMDDELNIIKI